MRSGSAKVRRSSPIARQVTLLVPNDGEFCSGAFLSATSSQKWEHSDEHDDTVSK
jgi:hypothetical protein